MVNNLDMEKGKLIVLDKTKTDKYDEILKAEGGINAKIKDTEDRLTKEEMVELKSYAIVKAIQIKRYVRN